MTCRWPGFSLSTGVDDAARDHSAHRPGAPCGHARAGRQQPRPGAGQPGAVVQGSQDVTVGGRPAARAGDATTTGAPVVEGSPDVLINGRPAAVVGGRTGCGGVTVGGAANVFINGKPMAQAGSQTTGCTK